MRRRAGYALAVLVALALVYQLFFRYEYLDAGGSMVVRIDRLTGQVCEAWPYRGGLCSKQAK